MMLNILEVKIDIWIDEEDACCCGVYTLQKCRCNVSRQRESFKRKGDGQRERSTNPSPATAAPLYTLQCPLVRPFFMSFLCPHSPSTVLVFFFFSHRPGWFSQHLLLDPNYFLFPRYWVLVLFIILFLNYFSFHSCFLIYFKKKKKYTVGRKQLNHLLKSLLHSLDRLMPHITTSFINIQKKMISYYRFSCEFIIGNFSCLQL